MKQPKLEGLQNEADKALSKSQEEIDQKTKPKDAEALNNKRLLDFLGKYAVEHEEDEDELVPGSEKYTNLIEAFKLKETVTKKLQGIYTEHFAKKAGVSFEKDDLHPIDISLEQTLIEDPEKIAVVYKRISDFENFPKEIEALERQIVEQAGGTKEAADVDAAFNNIGGYILNKRVQLEKLKNSPFWKRSVTIDGKKIRKGFFNNTSEIDKNIEATEAEIEQFAAVAGKYQEMKDRLAEARSQILEASPEVAYVNEIIQEKLVQKFDQIFDTSNNLSIEDVANLKKEYDRVRDISDKEGKDFLNEEMLDEDFREDIDIELKDKVREEMINALNRAYDKGDNAQKNLQTYFKKILAESQLGDTVETKEWLKTELGSILGEIQEQYEKKFTGSPEELERKNVRLKAKKILINSYLQQLS